MAGLGAEQAQQAPSRGERPGRPQQQAKDQDGMLVEDATPEEQELYDRFVLMAHMALYSQQSVEKNAQHLAEGDRVQAAADIISGIALRVSANARDKGVEIPGEVLFHAGMEFAEEVCGDFAKMVLGEELSEEETQNAFYAAVDKFGKSERATGAYTDEMAADDVNAIKQMADNGELDRVMAELNALRSSDEAEAG